MSSDEASDVHFDEDSGSDGYQDSPQPKKAAPKKAPAKPKAAAKPAAKKAPAKKQPLASKKHAPNDSISDIDDDSDASSKPPPKKKAKADSDDEAFVGGENAPPGKAKSASEMYQKLSQLEHVLKRPDSYIGSVEAITQPMWVFDSDKKMMVHRTITFVPGFFKIFDEILVNAADNKINDPSMSNLKVVIDREKNQISVHNDGRGIPVEMHKKEGIMIPELIFGHLLTSSNYDDDQKKLTGGRNGYGAKLANIYSLEFIVETADKANGKKYKQIFKDNMSKKDKPKITDNKKDEEWTRITFTPDLQRFGMDSIDDDTFALLVKRVYDMAGTIKDIKVSLNEEKIKIKGFKQYVEMYLNSAVQAQADASGGAAVSKPNIIYEQVNERWEVAFALSDGEARNVSFANSISTSKGGTHVEMLQTQLANKLLETIKKKNKNINIKPFQIKNYMWIFVNALIVNPAFDSQTKEYLTLKSSAFGSKCELKEDFVKKVAKSGIVENVLSFAKFKQDQAMKKTDGAKRMRIAGIAKLEDANFAGGRKGKQCTLIITEGDSAKALAVSGLGVVGRDEYGVFPIRGKLLNVREASHDQIMKNVEIQHIRQILGLKHNKEYTDTDSLRYGHLMIMTDQDHDGSHIKGLLINFFDHFHPSLLRVPGFLVEFITPIVKVSKGKKELAFYTMPQYEEWKEANNDGKGWDAKYYKGLGTSTSADAKKYFSDLTRHRLEFDTMKPDERALIDMAFNKKKADDRKEWLRQFKPGTFLDHDVKSVPITDFVNKELILFSMADNIRSIPSVADGLKPGQRKVLFGAFKKKIAKEIKVAQLVGYVSEQTAYHHGEASLTSTIVGLAQTFVGSNNINLLSPNGQFGTRLAGGKDAASARYIFTGIPKITRALFHPSDDALLAHQIEDGMVIEPEYYLPTIPLVLVNGADGIGTGWSTSIPNYNPLDIIDNIRRMMRGEEPEQMDPWFRGYDGTIERTEADKYRVSGRIEKIDDTTVEITELPLRRWTQDFKEMLEEMTQGTDKVPASIKDYEEHHTDTTVLFRVHMSEAGMKAAEAEGLEKRFKMTTTLGTGNMVCFDLNGKIKKYATAEDILQDFYHKRLEFYSLRKQHLADELNKQFDKLSNQARFVQMIIKRELVVSNKKKAALVGELRELKFRPFPKTGKREGGQATGDTLEAEPALEEEDEGLASDYDYLLGMAIWSLTAEKVGKLLGERDAKEAELIELLKLSAKDIWNADIDRLLEEWNLVLEEDAAAAKGAKPKTKAAIKTLAKKAKRAAGDDDDSDDDFDFKPKVAPKPRAKPAAAKVEKGSPLRSVVSPVKRPSATISEVSEDEKPPAKKAAPVKKAPAAAKAKAKPVLLSDDEDEDDDMYLAPKKPTKGESSKQSTLDSFAAPVPKAAAKAPVKAKAAASAPAKKAPAKKKIVDSESEEEEDEAEDSDGDDDDFAVVSPPKKAPAAGKGKASASTASSSSGAGAAAAAAAAAAKKKPAPVKKKVVSESEDGSDGDYDVSMISDVAPVVKPSARPGRGAAKKTTTYIDLDDEDDD